jgi:hypothetical protein
VIEAKLCFGAEAHQCIVEKAQSSNPTYNFQGIKLVSTKHTATIKSVLSIFIFKKSLPSVNKYKRRTIAGAASLSQMQSYNGLETSGGFCKQAY